MIKSSLFALFVMFQKLQIQNMEAREDRQSSSTQSTPSTTPHSSPKSQRRYNHTLMSSGQRSVKAINLTMFTLCVFMKRLVRQHKFGAQHRLLLQQQFGHGRNRSGRRRRRRCRGAVGCVRTSTACS